MNYKEILAIGVSISLFFLMFSVGVALENLSKCVDVPLTTNQ